MQTSLEVSKRQGTEHGWGKRAGQSLAHALKAQSAKLRRVGELTATEKELWAYFKYNKVDTDLSRIKIRKGWFNETLPDANIHAISFLRLDGDLYVSTMDGLTNLYHKVSVGGYIYVDDYGSYEGCRLAVNQFRRMHRITEIMHSIDESVPASGLLRGWWAGAKQEAVWWRKERHVELEGPVEQANMAEQRERLQESEASMGSHAACHPVACWGACHRRS